MPQTPETIEVGGRSYQPRVQSLALLRDLGPHEDRCAEAGTALDALNLRGAKIAAKLDDEDADGDEILRELQALDREKRAAEVVLYEARLARLAARLEGEIPPAVLEQAIDLRDLDALEAELIRPRMSPASTSATPGG